MFHSYSALLYDHPWGNHIYSFESIDSTNTYAKQLALQGAPHGTVVISEHQTGGRGRLGRSFSSPAGLGIYMSIVLRFDCPPTELMHLTCAAAVATCDAIARVTGLQPSIKWINDLVLDKQKIAGILTELVTTGNQTCAIIGIGINCLQQKEDFPHEIRTFAGSLSMFTDAPIDRCALAAAMVEEFFRIDRDLLTEKVDIMRRYQSRCITLGKEVSIHRGEVLSHAQAISVTDDGALLVRYPDGSTETVCSGEASVRGMYGYI